MTDNDNKTAPLPSVRRMPAYLRLLYTLQANGREVVSCTHIAEDLGVIPVQVRKDLAVTGIVGKPKVGYQVPELIGAIEEFLGWKNTKEAFLVGAGSLGSALLGYGGFTDFGLNIIAGFDTDPKKIGRKIHGREILPLEKLPNLIKRMHVLIGILTVPASAAQEVADTMVQSGVRAIWNYTPVQLHLPETVVVEDVKLASSLAVLSNRLADMLRNQPKIKTQRVPPKKRDTTPWNKK